MLQGHQACRSSTRLEQSLFVHKLRRHPASSCLQNCGAGVKRLAKLGLVKSAPGMAALDMNSAEDAVVNHTREVVPGMVICGMEVCCIPPLTNDHREHWTGGD